MRSIPGVHPLGLGPPFWMVITDLNVPAAIERNAKVRDQPTRLAFEMKVPERRLVRRPFGPPLSAATRAAPHLLLLRRARPMAHEVIIRRSFGGLFNDSTQLASVSGEFGFGVSQLPIGGNLQCS